MPAPRLRVAKVVESLENPWDVGFLPNGQLLVTERPGRFVRVDAQGKKHSVRAALDDVYAEGEGGLMGLAVHPDFAASRQFTVCTTYARGGQPQDIRLVTWRLSQDGNTATKVKNLLTGLPVAVGGRHSGCRPTLASDGTLMVGTGDTARAGVSQDRKSLGGKVLRLNLRTGAPAADNPFTGARNLRERYVYTYGHRNVQGLARRPGTGQMLSAEHGPAESDEVNLLRRGANFGWDPSRGGSSQVYDESVPMTDTRRFPGAVPAVWDTGSNTEAICGATFVSGQRWKAYDGALVTTALKGAKMVVLRLNRSGTKVVKQWIPAEVRDAYGRLRAARTAPDGSLIVTTSNGTNDALLRITPQ